MSREISLYFAALSRRNSFDLIVGALKSFWRNENSDQECLSRLEREWSAKFSDWESIVFPSARAGLYALLRSMGIGEGDEVIITGFTCSAVPDSVLHSGAKPIYSDINFDDYGVSVRSVEQLVSPSTKAIVVQHTFGIAAEIRPLMDVAQKNNLYLIEDACLATGVKTEHGYIGTFGHAAIFSFELSKTLSAGWGGMVQTDVAQLGKNLRTIKSELGALSRGESIRRLLQSGFSYWLYHPRNISIGKYITALFFKVGLFRQSGSTENPRLKLGNISLSYPSDITWRIVLDQLSSLESIVDHSSLVASRYLDTLKKCNWEVGKISNKQLKSGLIRFPMLVSDTLKFIEYFRREGIEVGTWFDSPISPMPHSPSEYYYRQGSCPVSETVSKHIVNLPLHRRLSDSDIDHICNVLTRYCHENPQESVFVKTLIENRES